MDGSILLISGIYQSASQRVSDSVPHRRHYIRSEVGMNNRAREMAHLARDIDISMGI